MACKQIAKEHNSRARWIRHTVLSVIDKHLSNAIWHRLEYLLKFDASELSEKWQKFYESHAFVYPPVLY